MTGKKSKLHRKEVREVRSRLYSAQSIFFSQSSAQIFQMDLKKLEGIMQINLSGSNRHQWQAFVNMVMNLWIP